MGGDDTSAAVLQAAAEYHDKDWLHRRAVMEHEAAAKLEQAAARVRREAHETMQEARERLLRLACGQTTR